MHIRRYSFFTTLFLLVLGWAFYAFITQENISELNMLGVTIPEMPIAIASIVPALILFVLTLGHMIFYGFVEYVSNRAKNLDFKKLENAVELNLKNKSVNTQYTTSQFKDIGEILNIAKLSIDSSSDISEKK
jgi:hypothetical protein